MFTLLSLSDYIRFLEAIVIVFLVLAVDCASHGHNPYPMFQTVTQSYQVLMAIHTTCYLEPRNCIPCSTDWRLSVLEAYDDKDFFFFVVVSWGSGLRWHIFFLLTTGEGDGDVQSCNLFLNGGGWDGWFYLLSPAADRVWDIRAPCVRRCWCWGWRIAVPLRKHHGTSVWPCRHEQSGARGTKKREKRVQSKIVFADTWPAKMSVKKNQIE